jgi:hypothetical protein
MSLLNFNSTPFTDNLLGATNSLITQPQLAYDNITEESYQHGSGKTKQKKTKSKAVPKAKKEIDTYKKDQLVKIAKRHDVSLKARDGKVKTKEQLFNSLKRKKLL